MEHIVLYSKETQHDDCQIESDIISRLTFYVFFFWNFSDLKALKKNKSSYSIQLGGDECHGKEN